MCLCVVLKSVNVCAWLLVRAFLLSLSAVSVSCVFLVLCVNLVCGLFVALSSYVYVCFLCMIVSVLCVFVVRLPASSINMCFVCCVVSCLCVCLMRCFLGFKK